MSKKIPTPNPLTSQVVTDTLVEAERIVSFYEGCLDVVVAENETLESEIARLKSLLNKWIPRRAAPPGPPWGNRWRLK